MTPSARPYQGRTVTFATMHGKEQLAAEPFRQMLGARVTTPNGLNTDLLGTFAGDIPRTLSPIDAARVKARLGMHIDNTALGLASEGTFAATPNSPGLVENTELLLFIDDVRQIEVVEISRVMSPLAGPRPISDMDAGLEFATRIGFPRQGIVLATSDDDGPTWRKDLGTAAELTCALDKLFDTKNEVTIQPDYRAHACPTRAEHLRSLAERLAERLARPCPGCAAPGWGPTASEPGLPCRDCGEPTALAAATVEGCARCSYQVRTPVAARRASPEWCERCNP
ncbi:MAG: hypothetical protein HIU88_14005 [Acidobacteria bacterium]|nr:hypothetical protein [Acidobacteriota bacterium]